MLSDAAAERQATSRDFPNEKQQAAIREVLSSTDRVHGFPGLAGSGKTTTLSVIRGGAEEGGYKVEGFAPSSKAAAQLREAGIEATTLQSFLARGKDADPASRRLYMLDESSLASTRQTRAFLERSVPATEFSSLATPASIKAWTQAGRSSKCGRPGCRPPGWTGSCGRKTPSC